MVEWLADGVLLLLAVATAVVAAQAWLRRPRRRTVLLAGAFGVAVAYAASEALKMVFEQTRPCAVWATATECPPPGDWSLPSNHATLAFGAVIVIVLATRSLWVRWTAVAAATVVAAARMFEGVHYLHDVTAGALLGLIVPAATARLGYFWSHHRKTPA